MEVYAKAKKKKFRTTNRLLKTFWGTSELRLGTRSEIFTGAYDDNDTEVLYAATTIS
jgi:hypothetical protein